jgi:hypothetical protein
VAQTLHPPQRSAMQASRPQYGDSTELALSEGIHNVDRLTKAFTHRTHGIVSASTALRAWVVLIILLAIFAVLGLIILSGRREQKHGAEQMLDDPKQHMPQSPWAADHLRSGSTMKSSFSSPLASTSSLGDTRFSSRIDRLDLPSPLVVGAKDGDTFVINGSIKPKKQDNQRIDITRFADSQVVARVHVSEDKEGCGMLIEISSCDASGRLQPYGRSVPFAFVDTSAAFKDRTRSSPQDKVLEPQVSLLGASLDGWDATATPTAIVKGTENGAFSLTIGGQDVLLIARGRDGTLGHIANKDHQLLARISDSNTVHCAGGSDAGLILCTVVACMKML